ncbi:hypothetical protein V6N13_037886 [Hibiscus sabdariffa]|uniref:Uncharacterized protein n=1 Tax=Hibiscus sabdariffa TaxID=183260 RepID=A0ABR2S4A5_9ROSI
MEIIYHFLLYKPIRSNPLCFTEETNTLGFSFGFTFPEPVTMPRRNSGSCTFPEHPCASATALISPPLAYIPSAALST